HNQGPFWLSFNLPTQLPIVSLRAISRRHELEQQAFNGSSAWSEIDVNSVHGAATEQQVFDPTHPGCTDALALPGARNRGFCFAGAGASIDPKSARKRWIASEKPAVSRHRILQVRGVPACASGMSHQVGGAPRRQGRSRY